MTLQAAASPVRYNISNDMVESRIPVFRIPNSYENSGEDNLPKDPRMWTRDHVAQWLRYLIRVHGLPEVPSSRFLMNGKALCLMSPGMFLSRVPLGGKLLYKDFQLRLCSAMYSRN